jgi:hypothetical protein
VISFHVWHCTACQGCWKHVGTKPLPTSSQLRCATAISYTKLRQQRRGKERKGSEDAC